MPGGVFGEEGGGGGGLMWGLRGVGLTDFPLARKNGQFLVGLGLVSLLTFRCNSFILCYF